MAKWKYFSFDNWNYLLPETSGKLLRFIESELAKDSLIQPILMRALTENRTNTNKIIWLRFWPDTGHFSPSLIDKSDHHYTNIQGEAVAHDTATCLTYELISKSGRRQFFNVGIDWILKSARNVSSGYQLYHHRFLDPELDEDANQFVYAGITSRSWKERWNEHLGAARRGSPYLFHSKIREALEKGWIQEHSVNAVRLTESEAMNAEELAVADYALHPDNPRGLNMIPGGYAGMRALHRLGALKPHAVLSPDERPDIIESYLREHPRKGVPNPFISAMWKDEGYAASVVCGHLDRFSVEQVKLIRQLNDSGFSPSAIASLVHARNIEQVERVIAGKTYRRIQ